MKKIIFAILLIISVLKTNAQVVNTATMDTTDVNTKGKFTVQGYVDVYYSYDFSNPNNGDRPYFVSSARHNEFNVNLAFVDVKYSSGKFRARFVPGFGSYVNANYANEPLTLKNIIEGNIGLRIFKNKGIWLDVGVLGSPYTNESAISKDHLMYTRSFAPEYVPYYLSGAKLTVPLSTKLNAYLYILNGWQVIRDNNQGKSIGTTLEYRPNNYWLINWNTYLGDERSSLAPNFRARYFSDIYFIYTKDKFSATGCIYGGIQQRVNQLNQKTTDATWWQANLIGKYQFTPKVSLSGRIEYFDDPERVQITPITIIEQGFSSYSTGLCLNINPQENIFIRFEGRHFFSNKKVYLDHSQNPANTSQMLISSVTVVF
jgi:hypothetical protein